MIDNNKIPQEVSNTLDTLNDYGYESFLVGGCVRDLLMGKTPKDFDITTGAKPEQVKSLFDHVIDTGIKYGTITVLKNNLPIEVTTYRKDVGYTDGRRPDKVEFGSSCIDDIKRRDFTINGLLWDGNVIQDYTCTGTDDINNKIIRAIGNPNDRFKEDALRMMRAVRFSCQLNFDIEQDTFESICDNANLIVNISQERIRDELNKILLSDYSSRGLRLLRKTGLLKYILSELQECYGFDQKNPNHCKDVFEHILKVVESTPKELTIRLAALLHDIAKPRTFTVDEVGIGHFYSHHLEGYGMSKGILNRLKYDNKTIEIVSILVKEHMSRYPKLRNKTIKKLISRVGVDNLDNLISLQIADIIGSKAPYDFTNVLEMKAEIERVLNEKEPFSIKDLAINGHDLIELGYKPGKELGEMLKALLERVLENPELNNKDELVKIVLDGE